MRVRQNRIAGTTAPVGKRDSSTATLAALQAVKELLRWAKTFGRHFPWRETGDSYKVLLAEKLLQQTAVGEAVIGAYEELLCCYPTPADLANADIKVLERIVRPLGFSYRARELKALGEAIVERHRGQVPAAFDALIALPGVGEYTARAVLSFSFGSDVAVVDTNVARFLHRFYGINDPLPANPARKKSLIELAQALVPKGRSKQFNLAVLDLCASLCKAGRPRCEQCPIRNNCVVGVQNCELRTPN